MNKDFFLLCAAFVLIFMGYDTTQQYLSAFFHEQEAAHIAFVSLGIIYAAIGISAFVAPLVCRKLGLKKSLITASLAYPLFIALIPTNSLLFILGAAGILGFTVAILWNAHGTYLSSITTP